MSAMAFCTHLQSKLYGPGVLLRTGAGRFVPPAREIYGMSMAPSGVSADASPADRMARLR